MTIVTRLILAMAAIACKSCRKTFDKGDHNGYCPFCGADNN